MTKHRFILLTVGKGPGRSTVRVEFTYTDETACNFDTYEAAENFAVRRSIEDSASILSGASLNRERVWFDVTHALQVKREEAA